MSDGPPAAVVVGAGPNGLSAAITLARAGWSVEVLEARETPGGGVRTLELTLPGFRHDVCSAVHPLALASPFFRSLDPADFGVEWIVPPVSLAHPLDDGPAVLVRPSVEETARGLGRDEAAWRRLFGRIVARSDDVLEDLLAPLRLPKHPFLFGSIAPVLASPADLFARRWFREERSRAVFAGMAAHSLLRLSAPSTAGFGVLLTLLAHAVGWPIPRGGAQSITAGLVRILAKLGGTVRTGVEVRRLSDLPPADAVLFDTSPRALLRIAGERFPAGYRRALERYRYNPGVFKLDWALSGPIPWTDPEVGMSATVHLGGSLDEIAASERAPWERRHHPRPFVLLAQQSLFDPARAPPGRHVAWAYCHVPHGGVKDRTAAIEAQVERFAPGFRSRILARSAMNSMEMQAYNPNYVGGDVNGGVQDLRQLYFRPAVRPTPYRTPAPGLYLCSASTPPGGGVHGMCGVHAARTVLSDFRRGR